MDKLALINITLEVITEQDFKALANHHSAAYVFCKAHPACKFGKDMLNPLHNALRGLMTINEFANHIIQLDRQCMELLSAKPELSQL